MPVLPRVSVVTISFNQARFIGEAMKSVLDQGYENLDYIVVDAGSTDGSRSMIERIGGARVKTLFEADSGPGDGLNNGFAMASGEIFGFLNSDDVLRPGAILSAVERFEELQNVDVVSGDGVIIDERGVAQRRVFSDIFSYRAYLHGAAVLVQPSTFFRRDVWRGVGGFNASNESCWDGEFWAEAAKHGYRFGLSREVWSEIRLYHGTITSSLGDISKRKALRDELFFRLDGRQRSLPDQLSRLLYLCRKYACRPEALYERLLRGSIFSSCRVVDR